MSWAPDYATVQELRDYKRILDADDDAQLALALTAASRAVDRATNRQFGLTAPQTRTYAADYDARCGAWTVQIDDVMSTPTVESDGTAITEFTLTPRNADANGRPWTALSLVGAPTDRDAVDVTATFGWLTVPDTIKAATLLQASRFLSRRDSPWGVAGSPATGGTEIRLLERVDPDVRVMIGSYVRWWGAA